MVEGGRILESHAVAPSWVAGRWRWVFGFWYFTSAEVVRSWRASELAWKPSGLVVMGSAMVDVRIELVRWIRAKAWQVTEGYGIVSVRSTYSIDTSI